MRSDDGVKTAEQQFLKKHKFLFPQCAIHPAV